MIVVHIDPARRCHISKFGTAGHPREFAKLTRISAICILEMYVKQNQKRYKEDSAARLMLVPKSLKQSAKKVFQALSSSHYPG